MKIFPFLLAFLLLATPAQAQEMTFGWPAACEPGVDCWVVHHLDHDPAPGATSDFACGHLTYDGHDGTDIGIRDRNVVVDVVASADGVVQKTRNDQPDHNGGPANTNISRLARTECGNTVLLQHENGWRTFYCHMREGSVTVVPGQTVTKGEKLGEIGQSGLADFPHVHLEILKGKATIDPFTGEAASTACGTGTENSLWDVPVTYNPVFLYAAGFSPTTPHYEQVVLDATSPDSIGSEAPVLIFWFLGVGGAPGDWLRLQVTDPSGKIVAASDTVQQKSQIRIMRYTGLQNKTGRLKRGTYKGIAQLTRTTQGGETIERSIEQSVIIR